MSTTKPQTIPPLAQSTVGDVEIVCCLSCCPVQWFTRAKTPMGASSSPKGGFEPTIAAAKNVVEIKAKGESAPSRRPSLVAQVTAVAESKEDTVAKAAAVAAEIISAKK